MTSHAPRIFQAGEGRSYQLGGITFEFKHDPGMETGGFTVCEARARPGSGAGVHRHPWGEWHIVVEGESECILDGERSVIGPGAMVFIPAGVAHGFREVGATAGRQILLTAAPGAFEGFVAEVAAALVDSGSPSRAGGTPDFRAIAARHRIEFVDG